MREPIDQLHPAAVHPPDRVVVRDRSVRHRRVRIAGVVQVRRRAGVRFEILAYNGDGGRPKLPTQAAGQRCQPELS